MAITDRKKKQLKARRIKAVYESMEDERKQEIASQICDIALGFDHILKAVVEKAEDHAANAFECLLADGYTEDELEAVFTHDYCGSFEHSCYRNVRDVWTRHWPSQREQRLASIPIQIGKTGR